MNQPEFPAGGAPPSKKEFQLQGPRPPPLKVRKESHKIKKPPPPCAAHRPPEKKNKPQREPVISYSTSPKVISVSPCDFKDLVQRLTGLPPGEDPPERREDVSPAASPSEREKVLHSGNDDSMSMLNEGVQVGQFPGRLMPEPATLPPIPTMFSPASEALTASYWNEFSQSYWPPSTLPPIPTTLPPIPMTLPPIPTTLPPIPMTLPPIPTTLPPIPMTLPPVPMTLSPIPTTLSPIPTTLSPIPTTLPPIPTTFPPIPTTFPPIPTMFSPSIEAQTVSYWNEFAQSYWSPASNFLASPSGFLPTAAPSPQPSPNRFSLFDK